jgi:hypothetical protein
MMTLRLLLAATALTLAVAAPARLASAAAAGDRPQDYAYSLAVSVARDEGVTVLGLPQPVYRYAHSANLNDLRLFDRQGRSVPFAIVKPPGQVRTETTDLPVRVFPLTGPQSGGERPGGAQLDIRTDANGRLLSVSSQPDQSATPAVQGLSGLILDIGAAGTNGAAPALSALRFELPEGMRNYTAQLWLETSDDLQHWEAVCAVELNWMANADAQTLSNNRMPFEPARFRYARISWKQGTPLLFARVVAESMNNLTVPPARETLVLQPDAASKSKELVYRAGAAIPVEQVGMQFNEANAVLPVVLGHYEQVHSYRRNREPAWIFQSVLGTTFYRISQAGKDRQSGDAAIPITHAALWIARTQQATAMRPALRLSWTPGTLLFLANGNGPYQLAFGRDNAQGAALEVGQVAPGFSEGELRQLPRAQAAPLARQGPGGAAAETANSGATPALLRSAALWTVLLAGTALLAYFARTLLRQMDGNKK